MNYYFYANSEDHITILNYIFEKTDLRIYDFYSAYELPIREYKSIEKIKAHFYPQTDISLSLNFALWSERHGGQLEKRKIDLNPKNCDGKTFRYCLEGTGLIQLYFDKEKTRFGERMLSRSRISHLSLTVANAFNEDVDDWNWQEISSKARKMRYFIHEKLRVRKIGGMGVLKGADELSIKGVNFYPKV